MCRVHCKSCFCEHWGLSVGIFVRRDQENPRNLEHDSCIFKGNQKTMGTATGLCEAWWQSGVRALNLHGGHGDKGPQPPTCSWVSLNTWAPFTPIGLTPTDAAKNLTFWPKMEGWGSHLKPGIWRWRGMRVVEDSVLGTDWACSHTQPWVLTKCILTCWPRNEKPIGLVLPSCNHYLTQHCAQDCRCNSEQNPTRSLQACHLPLLGKAACTVNSLNTAADSGVFCPGLIFAQKLSTTFASTLQKYCTRMVLQTLQSSLCLLFFLTTTIFLLPLSWWIPLDPFLDTLESLFLQPSPGWSPVPSWVLLGTPGLSYRSLHLPPAQRAPPLGPKLHWGQCFSCNSCYFIAWHQHRIWPQDLASGSNGKLYFNVINFLVILCILLNALKNILSRHP